MSWLLPRLLRPPVSMGDSLLRSKKCDGSSECPAERHLHGCFADTGNCTNPEEPHARRTVMPATALRDDVQERLTRMFDAYSGDMSAISLFEDDLAWITARLVRWGNALDELRKPKYGVATMQIAERGLLSASTRARRSASAPATDRATASSSRGTTASSFTATSKGACGVPADGDKRVAAKRQEWCNVGEIGRPCEHGVYSPHPVIEDRPTANRQELTWSEAAHLLHAESQSHAASVPSYPMTPVDCLVSDLTAIAEQSYDEAMYEDFIERLRQWRLEKEQFDA